MKKLLLSLILVVSIYADNLKTHKDQTLFGSNWVTGGYIIALSTYQDVSGKSAFLGGVKGGIVLDDDYSIELSIAQNYNNLILNSQSTKLTKYKVTTSLVDDSYKLLHSNLGVGFGMGELRGISSDEYMFLDIYLGFVINLAQNFKLTTSIDYNLNSGVSYEGLGDGDIGSWIIGAGLVYGIY